MNGCRFSVEHAAVAYNTDAIHFPLDGHFLHGRIGGSDKAVRVPAVTLGKLLKKYDFETINLISDIEGAEIDLVEQEPDVLRGRVKTLVMETHAWYCGEDKVSAMLAALARLGFDPGEPLAGGKAGVVVMVNRNL
jgi:hypothetical protein